MEAAIIGVLGTGLLGMLGFFLQAIRSDLRALSERMDAGFVASRNDLGEVKDVLGDVQQRLAAIEATQAEHGRLLARMADHGERIAALEGAAGAR